jgi:hypothetical protein
MVRTSLRNTMACPPARCATTVELLDRTGIIAASLPRRRRSELDAVEDSPAEPQPSQPQDQDLRPHNVVIHRRAKGWIGALAAAGLLGIGWLGGGLSGAPERDNAAPVEVQQNVVERPVPAPPAPPVEPMPGPVTTEAPVVVHHQPGTGNKSPRTSAKPLPEARADVPVQQWNRKPRSLEGIDKQITAFVQPLMNAAASLIHDH